VEEDCSASRCCKDPGQTCYEKNQFWATCLDSCLPGEQKHDKDGGAWSCKRRGERTPFPSGCSWAGKDCSSQTTCCNRGFACARKDKFWTACVQVEQGPWTGEMPTATVPMPKGWSGKILGRWREEYEVKAVPSAMLSGTTLFCFMAVLPGSPEMALVDAARSRKASIFGCEGYRIYNSSRSDWATWSTGQKTLVNTGAFVKIWQQVKQDGQHLLHDWTVKVDADCVWFPARLRTHIRSLRAPAATPIYLKNALAKYTNGGFLGAIEILSRAAIEKYLDNADSCVKHIGLKSGEDGYLKDCMDALGVGFMHDELIMNPSPQPATCQMSEFAAFHPMKAVGDWASCYDIADGNVVPPPPMRLGSVIVLPSSIVSKYVPPDTPPAKLAAAAQIAGVPVPVLAPAGAPSIVVMVRK